MAYALHLVQLHRTSVYLVLTHAPLLTPCETLKAFPQLAKQTRELPLKPRPFFGEGFWVSKSGHQLFDGRAALLPQTIEVKKVILSRCATNHKSIQARHV